MYKRQDNYKDLDAEKVGMVWIDLKDEFSQLKSDIIAAETSAGDVHYAMKDIDKRVGDLERQFGRLHYWFKRKVEDEAEDKKYFQMKAAR